MPRGSINGKPYAVPDGYEIISDTTYRWGNAARRLLSDLTRSPHGRHGGDAEFQTPGGVSQGNPFLKTGQRIGTSISGKPITVPEPARRADPDAWYTSEAQS